MNSEYFIIKIPIYAKDTYLIIYMIVYGNQYN